MLYKNRQIERPPHGAAEEVNKMVKNITADNFGSAVLASDRPVLVGFSASGCRPCRILRPTLEDISDDLAGVLDVATVDIGVDAPLAKDYNIAAVPTMLLFVGGKPADKLVGLQSHQEIEESIMCALGVETYGYTSEQ